MPAMRMFDVQGVEIAAPRSRVFEFLREPRNLPRWAHAFVSAGDGRARLDTPAGAVDIALRVSADAETGVVDWRLEFPDGSVGLAHSRVTDTTRGTCIYSFVLHAPPVPLEQWNREDAEDATQEILVRAVTRLSQFDFRSAFRTWVYRIAVNYVLDVKKSPVERMHLTFERFAEDLADGLSAAGPAEAERSLLTEEVKIGCTFGMLQCLDRPHRLAYVLGEILDVPGPEAAAALDMSPALFRKRLQHARAAIESFTRSYCGLASDSAACACHRRVPAALRAGRIRADTVDFAAKASSYRDTRDLVRRVEAARQALEVHRSSHPKASSTDFARRLARAIDASTAPRA